MSQLIIEPLPYQENSSLIAAQFQHWPCFVFLDSCQPHTEQGRYDIISADPDCTLVTHGQNTRITSGDTTLESSADPFSLVQQALAHYGPAPHTTVDIPFNGGAIGYFSYELGRDTERPADDHRQDIAMPDMQIGIYLWAIVVDHQQQSSHLIFHPRCKEATRQRVRQQMTLTSQTMTCRTSEPFHLHDHFHSCISRSQYDQAFAAIKNYLIAGDCYQINLTQQFESHFSGNPWDAYLLLRCHSPAPWAAFLGFDSQAVLCFSPERFLHVERGTVETRPIKGTAPRSPMPEQDAHLARSLQQSSKDRAENLMIVDLLRNDLGKNCLPGSITVSKLFALESFSNVHHLVSTVCGQLAPQKHVLDLLRGCFPGGSITGAPKHRAMQIIDELESHRRNIYCGSIAYIGFNGDMDSNIVIRTLVCKDQQIACWAGGGITADSNVDAEYRELLDKVRPLLIVLEGTVS